MKSLLLHRGISAREWSAHRCKSISSGLRRTYANTRTHSDWSNSILYVNEVERGTSSCWLPDIERHTPATTVYWLLTQPNGACMLKFLHVKVEIPHTTWHLTYQPKWHLSISVNATTEMSGYASKKKPVANRYWANSMWMCDLFFAKCKKRIENVTYRQKWLHPTNWISAKWL